MAHTKDTSLDELAARRATAPDWEQALRDGLREWASEHYGTVDAFCVAVAQRGGWTVAHVRNALTYPKGRAVLDAAVEVYLEERQTTEAA